MRIAVPAVGPTNSFFKNMLLRNMLHLLLVCVSSCNIWTCFFCVLPRKWTELLSFWLFACVISKIVALILSKICEVNKNSIWTSWIVLFHIPVDYKSTLGEIRTACYRTSPHNASSYMLLIDYITLHLWCMIFIWPFLSVFNGIQGKQFLILCSVIFIMLL
jgi:hypothetical protein